MLRRRSGIASGTSGSFFYNSGCGNTRAGIAQRKSATLPVSRCEFESRGLPHSFPSSNGEDSGLSSRECRFNSGREHHGDVAQRAEHSPCTRTIWVRIPSSPPFHSRCSAAASVPRSGRGERRFESFRRDHTPVAQRTAEHAVTAREVEGSNPSGGTIFKRRCNSEAGVSACPAESRGFESRQRRHRFSRRVSRLRFPRRVTQRAE